MVIYPKESLSIWDSFLVKITASYKDAHYYEKSDSKE